MAVAEAGKPHPGLFPPSSRALLSPHFGTERHLVSLLRPHSPVGRESGSYSFATFIRTYTIWKINRGSIYQFNRGLMYYINRGTIYHIVRGLILHIYVRFIHTYESCCSYVSLTPFIRMNIFKCFYKCVFQGSQLLPQSSRLLSKS